MRGGSRVSSCVVVGHVACRCVCGMGVCSSSVEDGASRSTKANKRHRAKQRSDSELVPADPTAMRVAHITPRMSMDYEPPCHPSADQPPACDGECHCYHEAEHKEPSQSRAVLSAMIVIDSPAAENRELLVQSDVGARPASSSQSTDVPPAAAEPTTPIDTNHSANPLTSPASASIATLPHSATSLPASPLATTIPAHHQHMLAALSSSSSPPVAFTSPAHSRSNSVVGAACPVHARSHSLSILQVLREVNHSRNTSVIFNNNEPFVKEEEEAKEGEEEEEAREGEEEQQTSGVEEKWTKGQPIGGEEKEMSVDDTTNLPSIHRARIDTIDKMACSV